MAPGRDPEVPGDSLQDSQSIQNQLFQVSFVPLLHIGFSSPKHVPKVTGFDCGLMSPKKLTHKPHPLETGLTKFGVTFCGTPRCMHEEEKKR